MVDEAAGGVADGVIVERVQTGMRIEKRLLKVVKGLAEYLDLTLGDLVEGLLLHGLEAKPPPFDEHLLEVIGDLKRVYGLDLDASASHKMIELTTGDEPASRR